MLVALSPRPPGSSDKTPYIGRRAGLGVDSEVPGQHAHGCVTVQYSARHVRPVVGLSGIDDGRKLTMDSDLNRLVAHRGQHSGTVLPMRDQVALLVLVSEYDDLYQSPREAIGLIPILAQGANRPLDTTELFLECIFGDRSEQRRPGS